MYQTNALIRDQKIHLEETCLRWQTPVRVETLDRTALDERVGRGDYTHPLPARAMEAWLTFLIHV